MQFMQVLDVFIGLAQGLTPEEVSEPIKILSEELRTMAYELEGKIDNLDFSNREKEAQIANLSDDLYRAEQENTRLKNNGNGNGNMDLLIQVLRTAVDKGKIDPCGDSIHDAIMGFYRAFGNKIHTIKHLRAMTGMGLKEAKDQVEEWTGSY